MRFFYIGIILISSCSSFLRPEKCDEKDVECRTKRYIECIKKGDFETLKNECKLDKQGIVKEYDNLKRLQEFLNKTGGKGLIYKKEGTDYSDWLTVTVGKIYDTTYLSHEGFNPIIEFNFIRKSVVGVPFASVFYLGLPILKNESEVLERLNEIDEQNSKDTIH